MRKAITSLFTFIFSLLVVGSAHAVPQEWSLEVSSTRPYQFTAYHGETLELAASFTHNGAPWQLSGDYALFWQTNGMSGYWTAPASVVSNRVSATFTGAMDPGAPIVYGFLGSTGSNYRAAFSCRFQSSPGAAPNALPLPVETIDFSQVVPLNAPWPIFADLSAAATAATNHTDSATNATTQALMAELGSATNAATNYTDSVATSLRGEIASAAPGDYAVVSNRAMSALQSYSETDPTVPEWARSPTKPTYAAADVGAADAASFAAVSNDVAAISATLNAENARFVSTNYNSSVHLAEASVEAKVDGSWLVIWREMARWDWFLGEYLPTNYYDKAALDDAFDGKADRAWGFYDPMTGDYAPDNCIWLGAPHVYVCAGMSYQRVADTRGYWVLTSNGMVADLNGTTNGYFRISDSDGETQFEIVKGDKQTLGAQATALSSESVMGVTHYYTSYAVTNAVSAPVATFSRSLAPKSWIAEDDPLCPCNVEWEQTGAAEWTCEWWPKSYESRIFLKVEYERGGETYINNVAPVSMQYIYLGGVKYSLGTATISGNTVLTLTVAP